jgi:hypothetical protein
MELFIEIHCGDTAVNTGRICPHPPCIVFCRSLFNFLYSFFGNCIVSSTVNYDFWVPLRYLQTLISIIFFGHCMHVLRFTASYYSSSCKSVSGHFLKAILQNTSYHKYTAHDIWRNFSMRRIFIRCCWIEVILLTDLQKRY